MIYDATMIMTHQTDVRFKKSMCGTNGSDVLIAFEFEITMEDGKEEPNQMKTLELVVESI